ncbi:MAG: hypothetical protein Udaeo2_20120 [Candidatus Udaeobacter sp.]|nr:MAG: hypothetical protein Udaeo2_20120 [Candidatus Udaeobacter sp.]
MHNHVDQTMLLEKLGSLKSFGQVLVRGFLMTRGPAKPIMLLGSAIMTSPSDAKLAMTPAVVGFVRTEM